MRRRLMIFVLALLASKAWFARDGRFDGIDAVLFTHVGSNLGTSWGAR